MPPPVILTSAPRALLPSRAPSGLFAGLRVTQSPRLLLWLSAWKGSPPPPPPARQLPARLQVSAPAAPSRSTGLRFPDPASGGSQPPHLPYFSLQHLALLTRYTVYLFILGSVRLPRSDVNATCTGHWLTCALHTLFSEPRGAGADQRMRAWQSEVCGAGATLLTGPRKSGPMGSPRALMPSGGGQRQES